MKLLKFFSLGFLSFFIAYFSSAASDKSSEGGGSQINYSGCKEFISKHIFPENLQLIEITDDGALKYDPTNFSKVESLQKTGRKLLTTLVVGNNKIVLKVERTGNGKDITQMIMHQGIASLKIRTKLQFDNRRGQCVPSKYTAGGDKPSNSLTLFDLDLCKTIEDVFKKYGEGKVQNCSNINDEFNNIFDKHGFLDHEPSSLEFDELIVMEDTVKMFGENSSFAAAGLRATCKMRGLTPFLENPDIWPTPQATKNSGSPGTNSTL